MANEILTFRIDVDSATGIAKLRQFDNAVNQSAGNTVNAGQKMSGGLSGVEGAAGGAAAGISSVSIAMAALGAAGLAAAGFFKTAIADAREAEDVMNSLRGAVESAGDSWSEQSGQISDYLRSLQRVSRFTDEDLGRSLDQLITITGDTTTGVKALQVVMDTATARGKSLSEVTQLIGLALEGNIRGLRQILPQLDAHTKKRIQEASEGERAYIVLNELTNAYGGRSFEAIKSYNGQLTVLGNQLREVKEQAGGAGLSVGAFLARANAVVSLSASQGNTGIYPVQELVRLANYFSGFDDAVAKANALAKAKELTEGRFKGHGGATEPSSFEGGGNPPLSPEKDTILQILQKQIDKIREADAIGKKYLELWTLQGKAGPDTVTGFPGTGPTPTPGVLPPGIVAPGIGPVGPPGTDVHEQMALYGIDLETIQEKQDRQAGGQQLLNELYAAGRISLDSYREGLTQLGVETDTYNDKLIFSQQTVQNLQAAETALGLAQQFIATEGVKARQKHAKANAAIIIAEASLKAAFEIAEAAASAASGNYAGAALHAVSAALYLAVGRNQAAAALKTGSAGATGSTGSDRPQRGGLAPGARTFGGGVGSTTVKQQVTINALDGNSVRDVVRSKGYQRQHARMMRDAARRN